MAPPPSLLPYWVDRCASPSMWWTIWPTIIRFDSCATISKPTSCAPSPVRAMGHVQLTRLSHCYHHVIGPANLLAYVKTSVEVCSGQLCAIATGVVQFDKQRHGVIKLANLSTTTFQVQNGSLLATVEIMGSINAISIKNDNNTSSTPASTTTPGDPFDLKDMSVDADLDENHKLTWLQPRYNITLTRTIIYQSPAHLIECQRLRLTKLMT
ncbi:hypothetical protein PHYBLDRAFT_174788 [Phycomyces blakesleeanus NRRL 1555(-)]|uniref:Uncharacterized protein n=1 Tax=Phycomyces blakesleeanus (strain ATCC 8743b / DSM 1359 / FGSC 10004 / NBRC 33097 / NRRL 1555) TaxID=763407 RepID=A0A162WFA5_PHYB8|nr:hypothetical protein PHYBLDRAFT_174788 [Phycomyces blakesleeanus NRRL 1555(-)]OAD66755.1 hypothetical protein PHYBLDRAFT_174788 [Phycomyces blakesleeanus NRRL 1555(-)]|eukprot:XP_018284795.1 hypothetical protein PHYBLDRAFT_174788 [Phycomyces blakesleeanus NRRL 1555(-)]